VPHEPPQPKSSGQIRTSARAARGTGLELRAQYRMETQEQQPAARILRWPSEGCSAPGSAKQEAAPDGLLLPPDDWIKREQGRYSRGPR